MINHKLQGAGIPINRTETIREGDKEVKKVKEHIYILLMENLLLGVDENVIKYDLKGSRRNRYIKEKYPGRVTLDNNFL
jgi:hypothetical protein